MIKEDCIVTDGLYWKSTLLFVKIQTITRVIVITFKNISNIKEIYGKILNFVAAMNL